MTDPLTLRLYRDAPAHAEQVVSEFAVDDVALRIYLLSEEPEVVRVAASSLAQFGDLALYVMGRWGQDDAFQARFVSYLSDSRLGVRTIPFVARFGDEAFDRLDDDVAWVDRYFNDDGTEREDSLAWISALPGGAIVTVARNWLNGYPCEWSELGWAAFDTVELALLIGSLGSSSVIATGLREAAEGTATGTLRQTGRAAAREAWRHELAQGTASTVRLSRARRVVMAIRDGADAISRPIRAGFRLATAPLQLTARLATDARTAWRALSPVARRRVIRSLFAATLIITLTSRTIPNLDEIGEGIGRMLGAVVANVAAGGAHTVGGALSGAMDRLAGDGGVLFWVVGACLALVLLWLIVSGLRSWALRRRKQDRRSVQRSTVVAAALLLSGGTLLGSCDQPPAELSATIRDGSLSEVNDELDRAYDPSEGDVQMHVEHRRALDERQARELEQIRQQLDSPSADLESLRERLVEIRDLRGGSLRSEAEDLLTEVDARLEANGVRLIDLSLRSGDAATAVAHCLDYTSRFPNGAQREDVRDLCARAQQQEERRSLAELETIRVVDRASLGDRVTRLRQHVAQYGGPAELVAALELGTRLLGAGRVRLVVTGARFRFPDGRSGDEPELRVSAFPTARSWRFSDAHALTIGADDGWLEVDLRSVAPVSVRLLDLDWALSDDDLMASRRFEVHRDLGCFAGEPVVLRDAGFDDDYRRIDTKVTIHVQLPGTTGGWELISPRDLELYRRFLSSCPYLSNVTERGEG